MAIPQAAIASGQHIAKALDKAHERVAALLGCDPGEIVFTSCGTESTNAAINSALLMDRDRQHIVTTRVEHSATLKHCETLAKRGHEVTWLNVDDRGQIDLAELESAIRPDTAIVSVMWANNETGVVFPIHEIAEIVRKKHALFHTDAVQAVGKIPLNLAESKINFLSMSGHKLHCPKGVGVLYVHRRTKFAPYVIGGGQENGKRAGTQNVAGIVALGKASELAGENLGHEKKVGACKLRDDFEHTGAFPKSRVRRSMGRPSIGCRIRATWPLKGSIPRGRSCCSTSITSVAPADRPAPPAPCTLPMC